MKRKTFDKLFAEGEPVEIVTKPPSCVCCDRLGAELLPTDVFHQDTSGEWWCQHCIKMCIPVHQDIAAGNYSTQEDK